MARDALVAVWYVLVVAPAPIALVRRRTPARVPIRAEPARHEPLTEGYTACDAAAGWPY
ncbi:MAG TPA: hypothetical protein VHU88_03825 [Sporichthyaceae bacterium]|nr:hypothetical protein [Sporichthyaceae bacterium]